MPIAPEFPALRRAPLYAAILLAVLAPAAAQAQDGGQRRDKASTLDAVEVEGQRVDLPASPRFTAAPVDLPQTLSVVPLDVFGSQGARNLTEVLRNVPGISFNAGENGFGSGTSNFSLRGFDTSGSIFVDGVRDSGNYPRDVFNVEQVEVAKGPAADMGRGGLGGYVNVVTKTPQDDDFLRLSGSWGFDGTDADDRSRATLDFNRGFGDGHAFRLNLLAQDGGIAGREHATAGAVGIAPSLALAVGERTRVVFSGQYLDQDGRPEWGVPAALVEGTIHYDPATAGVERDSFYGLAGDYDENVSRHVGVRIEHELSDRFRLSNLSRWSAVDREAAYVLPTGYAPATGLVDGQAQFYGRDNRTFANITEVSGSVATGGLYHQLAFGLELVRESSDARGYATVAVPATPVDAPDVDRVQVPRPAPAGFRSVDIDTAALYVFDTVTLGERWQLTGGLRAERYRVRIGSRDALGAPSGPDGYEVGETTLGGKLGLVYKPTAAGSLYAAFGLATLPPGAWLSNPDISRTGDGAFPGLVGQNSEQADPQRALNYEVGVKWQFLDGRLLATAAAFHTERRNVAIAGKEPGDPASPVLLRGYGRQVVRGIELGLTGRMSDAWQVFAGAVLLDSERRHSAYLDAALRESRPGDYGSVLRTDGDELAFTPRRSASLWTTYDFPSGFMLGGGLQYVGESWAGRPDDADRIIANGRFGKLPGYTVASLVASYAFSDRVGLRLNVDNATDRFHAVSGNWPMTRVLVGPSRSYLLSLDLRL